MLRYCLLCLFLWFTPTLTIAQTFNHEINTPQLLATTSSIEQRAFNAPDHLANNKYQLTKYLIKPFKNDYDKLRVLAYWIASHIAYDNYKYDNGKINIKEMKVHYDILKSKAGICTDFANLFAEMAKIANISSVEVVYGYVLHNVRTIKKIYWQREMPSTGHAWNKVVLNGRTFFVDTTYMSSNRIGAGRKYKSSLKHKLDLQKRMRTAEKFNRYVEAFYFDFSPRQEVKYNNQLHLMQKYIR